MANLGRIPNVCVVYKKTKKSKPILQIFENIRVDDILAMGKRKPYIPYKYEILDIGVGDGFIEKYKNKYKLN